MAYLDFGMTRDYVPEWDVWSGIRDIIQNAKDSEERGYPLSVRHLPNTSRLVIKNEGVELKPEDFLLGETSKRGDANQRGEHGEGLALAIMALHRAGYPTKVYTGGRSYIPEFRTVRGQDRETFALRVSKRVNQGYVEVIIEGVTAEQWEEFQKRFLWMTPPEDAIETSRGTLIRDENRIGKVFARGIYVRDMDDLKYGFDLKHIKLDRDRTIPDPWDLKWEMSQIIGEATNRDKMKPAETLELIEKRSDETRSLRYTLTTETKKKVTKAFKDKHGDDVCVADTGEEAAAVEKRGGKAVVVDDDMKAVLAVESVIDDEEEKPKKVKTARTWLKEKNEAETRVVQARELNIDERHALDLATRMILLTGNNDDNIYVVEGPEFKEIEFFYKNETRPDGYYIPREILTKGEDYTAAAVVLQVIGNVSNSDPVGDVAKLFGPILFKTSVIDKMLEEGLFDNLGM